MTCRKSEEKEYVRNCLAENNLEYNEELGDMMQGSVVLVYGCLMVSL